MVTGTAEVGRVAMMVGTLAKYRRGRFVASYMLWDSELSVGVKYRVISSQ